jgi:AraC-like DNA-binding protein
VVLRGQGWFHPQESVVAPIQLQAGDHLLTTRGMPHELLSAPGAAAVPIDSLIPAAGQSQIVHDSPNPNPSQDANGTLLLVGQFELSELKQNPLDIGLPDLIHLNQREASLRMSAPIVRLIEANQQQHQAGWKVIVQRLGELVLLQTVAAALTERVREPVDSASGAYRMMKAATDVVIGPALRVIVDAPEADWTVPQLAKIGKVSKSAFSERFRRLVGLPPLQYLTEIRMAKSRRLLRDSDVEISEIANMVGYESPSSFSNVFKRWHGQSPFEYRRRYRRESADRPD